MRLKIGTRISDDEEDGSAVYIAEKELFQHCFGMGKSGTGKSVWLLNVFKLFFWMRWAVILIEPSGYMSRDAWSICGGKATYCSLKHPVPINIFRLPFDIPTICGIFREALNQSIVQSSNQANKDTTVKMNVILDEQVKASIEAGNPSIRDVRDRIAGLRGNNETRDGIVARLDFLLGDPRMNQILCGEGTLDIADLTANQKIFILDTSSMTVEQLTFIGNLASNIIKAHMRFAPLDSHQPLAVLVDECGNYTNYNWATILAEGRKYKLSVFAFTQQTSGLPERLRRILAASGTHVCFRVPHTDATQAASELHTDAKALQFLEKYHFGFLTPSSRGIAKAPRPPVFTELQIPEIAEPKTDYRPESKPPKTAWFPLEPLHDA